MCIIANHCGIDVPKAVNLRTAKESNIDVSTLEILRENIKHTANRYRTAYQRWIPN
jgi:hypothetical protein